MLITIGARLTRAHLNVERRNLTLNAYFTPAHSMSCLQRLMLPSLPTDMSSALSYDNTAIIYMKNNHILENNCRF